MKRLFTITVLASAVIGGAAIAQDEPERGNKSAVLELTMTLIPMNAESPAVVTAAIELPRDSSGDYIPSANGVERKHVTRVGRPGDRRELGVLDEPHPRVHGKRDFP